MESDHYLRQPESHLQPVVATSYDRSHDRYFDPEIIAATVEFLGRLAGTGPAVEFAIGTGRIALPLAQSGVRVLGIDHSEPMLAELHHKEGAELVATTVGDMTNTTVCDDATLVYLVFNTITNLRTQPQQVECFRNAARHLCSTGRFVIETQVPRLHALPPGETIIPFDVSPTHLGFDEYVDVANQLSISHHYYIDGDRVRTDSPVFRYVWPSELDLMAQLAGMSLEARWTDWDRSPFTSASTTHVSVWRKP